MNKLQVNLKNFKTFYNNFQKLQKDPKTAVQELLNSGQMSQAQFNVLAKQANAIMGRSAF